MTKSNEKFPTGIESPDHVENVKSSEAQDLTSLGYLPELTRNRSTMTLLFQALVMASIPYGEGGPFMSAIYGGGQLSILFGWIIVCLFDQTIALSLAELASRFPTSAGPYYWSFQISSRGKRALSFITGWTWLIGNWTLVLSVNFGFASLIAGTIGIYHPDWSASSWQLLLIYYLITLTTFFIVAFGNRWLPWVDTLCAISTAASLLIILISLAVRARAGRHSAVYALTNFDPSLSGWGNFSFFIGFLPPAYTFCFIGGLSAMAEECADPAVRLPRAMSLTIPVGLIAGLFFVLPICFTLPPLEDIIQAPSGQALPYIYATVMGTPGGGVALMFFILVASMCCCISNTVPASRTTWAFSRDNAIPFAKVWSKVHPKLGVPVNGLALLTVVQMLLGLINLGSTSAFTAFVSCGVIGLSVTYSIPITISMIHHRKEVNGARWRLPNPIGWTVNIIAVFWICFKAILFSMPNVIPVTETSMSYASVVFVGFMVLSGIWYLIHARKGKFSIFTKNKTDFFQSISRPTRVRRFICNAGLMITKKLQYLPTKP